VRYTLFDSTRTHPVVVLSPKSDATYVISPAEFATEWVGLGECVVLDSPAATFRLTDELDSKELSCFHGGLRAYLPGLGEDPNPFRHPLLVEHRSVLTALTEAKRLATVAQDWEQIAVDLDRTNKSLEARVDDLEEQLEAGNAKIAALHYALSQRAPEVVSPVLEPEFLPSNMREAVEVAQAALGDRLYILPSALAAADDSPFQDPAAIYQALHHLAALSARMAAGPLGKSVKAALQELGIDYSPGIAPTTPKRLRQQFKFTADGILYICEEHLRIGSSSYDPKECARIYFTTSQLSGTRIVVGYVGRHLDVISTS
jgi:hypothetical protein